MVMIARAIDDNSMDFRKATIINFGKDLKLEIKALGDGYPLPVRIHSHGDGHLFRVRRNDYIFLGNITVMWVIILTPPTNKTVQMSGHG